MIELLRPVAAEDPERLAVVTDAASCTYGDVVRRAEEIAASLPLTGTRFAILSAEADVVVPALAAASLAGAEACVFPPEASLDAGASPTVGAAFGASASPTVGEAAEELLARFGQTHLLTPAEPARCHPRTRALSHSNLRVVAPEPAQSHATSRPHLVLTTGTTGRPRGVRHDWARLVRATGRVRPSADERWLLAYGLHQFAGLQVLLHVFAAGATLIAPTPRRPLEGLAAMRRHGVTHVSATPTYWRFVMAELRGDGGPVPALRQITLGGEAAPGPVLDQLRATFPGAALSHVYAASEFGATNSTKDGLPGLPADVLTRGEDADVAMRVVDGELWVRSRIGMLGYHGEEPVEADGWRATGDLVEQVGDRLLFRGRVSEIINVGGVKVHPLPIEEAVAAVPGVQVSRVFGRPNAMTGSIVAVEVVPVPGTDPDEVKAAVRAACAELPAAARPRSIKVVAEVSMAGGKILRRSQ